MEKNCGLVLTNEIPKLLKDMLLTKKYLNIFSSNIRSTLKRGLEKLLKGNENTSVMKEVSEVVNLSKISRKYSVIPSKERCKYSTSIIDPNAEDDLHYISSGKFVNSGIS